MHSLACKGEESILIVHFHYSTAYQQGASATPRTTGNKVEFGLPKNKNWYASLDEFWQLARM